MKKKIFSILSASLLLLGAVACNNASDSDTTDTTVTDTGSSSTGEEVKGETLEKVTETVVYASPDGSSEAAGTESAPKDLYTALTNASAGTTVYLLDGSYVEKQRYILARSGDAINPIQVIAKNPGKVDIDFTAIGTHDNNRGIQINGNYWYWYGVDIHHAGDNGMYIAGDYNIIEYCTFHDNKDSGLQLGRGSGSYTNIADWPNNNLIKNCTSYNNCDDHTYGENADGFACKLTNGEGNVFDGCIAYRNSDDGWDLYAKSDSGNVGTTVIMNCVAFENGWLLEKSTDPDGVESYATRDGDGIGFKLGGSNMEGSVIVENCLAFNNRLHGFSDNSNPGVLSLRNCTAFNNSCKMMVRNSEGTLDETGNTGVFGENDGQSDNFNLARTEDSYNNYYGLLSYITNKTGVGVTYVNNDEFLGSMGYSILSSGKNAYIQFNGYSDASSYDASKGGMTSFTGMSDSCFESLVLGYTVDKNLHNVLRNADGSVNMHGTLNVVDQTLLTYCEGNQIGAKLNYTSDSEYNHYSFTEFTEEDTVDYITARQAADVLEIMCNTNAVYQNVKLLTLVNGCTVEWTSQNEQALVVADTSTQYTSLSGLTYVWGIVHRSTEEDLTITLTATIKVGNETVTKDFNMVLKQNDPGLGEILEVDDKYMLTAYDDFSLPTPVVTDVQSYSDLALTEGEDYTVTTSITYAASSTERGVAVSKVYSSVPGVYHVTYTINSLLEHGEETLSKSFYVYVISASAPIDFTDDETMLKKYSVEEGCTVNVARDGVSVYGVFNNIYGNLYVATSNADTMTKEEIIKNGTQFDITDETVTAIAENANTSAYNVFILVTSKDGTYTSEIIKKEIEFTEVNTEEELYNLFNGKTSSNGTTIYSLTKDLDFSTYGWANRGANETSTFAGLFNGNGHTISNISINNTTDKHCNLIYKISGGTLMNVNFDNIKLIGANSGTTRVAIVGQMVNGYLHNIKMTNITAFGYQSVAALLAQAAGGQNYISNCSLVNDYDTTPVLERYDAEGNPVSDVVYPTIGCSGKYCGGIVANIQKDTSEIMCRVDISNCYVNAEIGTNIDTGGYNGGIVGRIKGDFDVYYVSISHCYTTGNIITHKNYAGGIVGGNESGAGEIYVSFNVADVFIYYVGTQIGLGGAQSVKNGSPIYGRYTVGLGIFDGSSNFGCIADYNSAVGSDYENFTDLVLDETFWVNIPRLDMENTWEYVRDDEGNLVAPYVRLK